MSSCTRAAIPAIACQAPPIIIIAAANRVRPLTHGDSRTPGPVIGSDGNGVLTAKLLQSDRSEHEWSSLVPGVASSPQDERAWHRRDRRLGSVRPGGSGLRS